MFHFTFVLYSNYLTNSDQPNGTDADLEDYIIGRTYVFALLERI